MIEGRQVFVLLILTVASAAGVPLKNIVINMVHRLETGNAHDLKKIPSTTFNIPETFSVVVYCFCFTGLVTNYS